MPVNRPALRSRDKQRDREHSGGPWARVPGDIGHDRALSRDPVERALLGALGLTPGVLATCQASLRPRKNAPVNQARLAFPHEERSGSPLLTVLRTFSRTRNRPSWTV